MKLIVGLGNPGPNYVGTRHNVGFEVIDRLAARWDVSIGGEKFNARFGKGNILGEPVVLLKPTTFMNRSGQAVLAAGRFYKLEVDALLVVSDDMALPPGRLRMRQGGSAGGHNGLQDIVDRLGSDAWCRLRIGIGEPMGNGTTHVLGRFSAQDEEIMGLATERGADAVECWVENGPESTMTRYNADAPI